MHVHIIFCTALPVVKESHIGVKSYECQSAEEAQNALNHGTLRGFKHTSYTYYAPLMKLTSEEHDGFLPERKGLSSSIAQASLSRSLLLHQDCY